MSLMHYFLRLLHQRIRPAQSLREKEQENKNMEALTEASISFFFFLNILTLLPS